MIESRNDPVLESWQSGEFLLSSLIMSMTIRWAAALLFFPMLSGCREDQNTSSPLTPFLSGPSVIVPVGVLKSPRGITADSTGEVWVSDTYNDRITSFTPDGSQRLSMPGFGLPGAMGFDRSSGDVLVVSSPNTVYRINTHTQQASVVAVLSGGLVGSGSVFNVVTGATESRTLTLLQAGDLDGALNGDVFVSCLANQTENYLVRVRGGVATAIAFSDRSPQDSLDNSSHFLSVDALGAVYTAFVFSDSLTGGFVHYYAVEPGNPSASHILAGTGIAGRSTGSAIDKNGLVFVADPPTQTISVLSTLPEGLLAVITIPPVGGMTQPAPWDVAVGPDGSVYVAVVDLFDTSHQLGAVLKYTRTNY